MRSVKILFIKYQSMIVCWGKAPIERERIVMERKLWMESWIDLCARKGSLQI